MGSRLYSNRQLYSLAELRYFKGFHSVEDLISHLENRAIESLLNHTAGKGIDPVDILHNADVNISVEIFYTHEEDES